MLEEESGDRNGVETGGRDVREGRRHLNGDNQLDFQNTKSEIP